MVDDDAVALGTSIDGPEFGMALATSIEHQNWEKLFCEKASNLKRFASMTDCNIVLSNCRKESESNVEAKSFVEQVNKLVKNSSN